jgi:hypothetical protein
MATLTFTGSVSQTWNASASWVGNAIPTLLDDAVFNSLSPTCSSATSPVCKSLDFTNYNKTCTIVTTLQLYGNLTLSATMSGLITTLQVNTSSNINTNNKQIINSITFGGDNATLMSINLTNPLTVNVSIVPSLTPLLFTGSYGFNTNSFNIAMSPVGASQIQLKPGLTFSTNTLSITSNTSTTYPIKSSIPGTRATFYLSATGSHTRADTITFIDIDASAGQTICVFNPGPSTSNNLNITELAAYKIQTNQFYTN